MRLTLVFRSHEPRLAALGERARGLRIGVGPQDLQRPRRRGVAESVRDVRRNPGRVEGLHRVGLAADLEHRLTFEQNHALFAVVAVHGDGRTGRELGDAIDEAFSVAREAGRERPTFDDMEKAVETVLLPSDEAKAEAFKSHQRRPGRRNKQIALGVDDWEQESLQSSGNGFEPAGEPAFAEVGARK